MKQKYKVAPNLWAYHRSWQSAEGPSLLLQIIAITTISIFILNHNRVT